MPKYAAEVARSLALLNPEDLARVDDMIERLQRTGS
jgi:hypothetical protein